jgi:hypothetical protein
MVKKNKYDIEILQYLEERDKATIIDNYEKVNTKTIINY